MTPEQFELPLPPQGMEFPIEPQLYATIAMGIVVAGFVLYALRDTIKHRSPLALMLLLGGAICYLNEPIVDVLGLVWHPRPNQWIALETFGPVPLWGLGIYIVFFGGMTLALYRQAQRGITRKAFWIGVLAFFIVDIAAELPLIHLGLYRYYGEPPYMFMGLPMYWLFINTPGPLIDVALLLRAPGFFKGWRMLLVPILPMTTDAMGSIASGWPIFSALNTPDASAATKWLAATLTIIIGLVLMEALSRLICAPAKAPATSANPAFSPQRAAPSM